MSPRVRLTILMKPSFPRVSGDEPTLVPSIESAWVFSLRERGSAMESHDRRVAVRVFPA